MSLMLRRFSPDPMSPPSRPGGARPWLVLLCLLVGPFGFLRLQPGVSPAHAAHENAAPLSPLPVDRVRGLAPLLRGCDLVLIESHPSGTLKQLSILTEIAARPDQVRDIILHAERYPEFVRNMTNSQITRNPDGSFDHSFQLSYSLVHFVARNRYVELPADPPADSRPDARPDGGPVAADTGHSEPSPIEFFDPNPGPYGNRHFRFEFHPAGTGTLLAVYAYTNLPGSLDFVRRFLRVTPLFEHGIALSTALAFVLAVKGRAEAQAGPAGVLLPAPGPGSYDFLLERGTVALLRSRQDRLQELSLIVASPASPDSLLDAARHSGRWSESVPIVGRSAELLGTDDHPLVDLQVDVPLFSFQTRYTLRTFGYSVDMLGVQGELYGARLRWDVQNSPTTRLVLRAQQQFERASLVLRQMYKIEPLLEYGVSVGLHLVLLQSIRAWAERGLIRPGSPAAH